MAKDDDLLPKRKSSAAKPPSRAGSGASASMLRLMRIARLVGLLLGGFVTLVGAMSLVGFITDSFWVRLVVALVVVVGFPAFVSDRVLKRTSLGGGLAMVTDIFAIVLLSVALVLVAADFASKPLLVREGDRYARSGSRAMARVVYFLGGVSPVFPEEGGPAPAGSGSAPASASSPPGASAK
ncbi:MAG: hypothetical protein KIS78_30140 [Labilithrix sp.]|nr:hypothetical protein [Labilithrix sp.]MCW5836695.1 hypothetical protein [Labilithrix sp.]